MHLLTQAGYFEFIEEVTMQSRVMIIAYKDELYDVRLDDEGDRIFNILLRSYTGLFADFVYVNESLIARRADVDEQKVYETFLALSRMKILQYIPRKTTPYLYYTTSRELPKYVVMPTAVYEDQRRRLEKRIEAMKKFAFAVDECRVSLMLRYFGEKSVSPCGKCDVCRERKHVRINSLSREELESSVMYMVSQEPRTVEYLVRELSWRRDDVIECVRRLVKRGKLCIGADDTISRC